MNNDESQEFSQLNGRVLDTMGLPRLLTVCILERRYSQQGWVIAGFEYLIVSSSM